MGADHRGVSLKGSVIQALKGAGLEAVDLGCEASETSVDYPDLARKVCGEVASGRAAWGVLICGSGVGMSIAANKAKGIRAALCRDARTAHMARAHNNANILALGADWTGPEEARAILAEWGQTAFEDGRHQRRLDKVEKIEAER